MVYTYTYVHKAIYACKGGLVYIPTNIKCLYLSWVCCHLKREIISNVNTKQAERSKFKLEALFICLVQVRLRTEVPRTPSSARLGLELMISRS